MTNLNKYKTVLLPFIDLEDISISDSDEKFSALEKKACRRRFRGSFASSQDVEDFYEELYDLQN